MKKILSLLLIATLLCTNSWTAFAATDNISNTPPKRTTCEVVRVVDGDTIVVNYNGHQETIRMIGVDCPESVHPNANKNTDAGFAASEFTKVMLTNKTVELEFDVAQKDYYGRLLAYVYLDGEMFNASLIEKGYANISTYPPNTKYVELFKMAQNSRLLDIPTGQYYDGYMLAPTSIYSTTSEQNNLDYSLMYVNGEIAYIGNSSEIDDSMSNYDYYLINTENGVICLFATSTHTIEDNLSIGKNGYICFQYITSTLENNLPVGIYYEYASLEKISQYYNNLTQSSTTNIQAAPTTANTTPALQKQSIATQSNQTNLSSTNNTRPIYITKTGSCYHYKNPCGRGTYYLATWEQAKHLSPCSKCVS